LAQLDRFLSGQAQRRAQQPQKAQQSQLDEMLITTTILISYGYGSEAWWIWAPVVALRWTHDGIDRRSIFSHGGKTHPLKSSMRSPCAIETFSAERAERKIGRFRNFTVTHRLKQLIDVLVVRVCLMT